MIFQNFAPVIRYVFTHASSKASANVSKSSEGVVIKRRGEGISETYTVRKISNGVGVERTFPLHTPRVDKIEVVRLGRVRRAKLYYLRALRGKAARIPERRK